MLNVNTALYSTKGVDIANVNSVANQILKQSNQNQVQVQAIDYSKFNRATLGIDLYSSRTNADLQKQVALTQAGLYAQAIDVASLNSAAAANLYSASTVQKNVGLAQSIQIQELAEPIKLAEESSKIQLFNISDKKSQSSNNFNPFNGEEELSPEESEKDPLSLFA